MSRIFFTKAGQKPSAFASLGLIIMIMTVIAFVCAGPVLGFWQSSSDNPEDLFLLRIKLLDLVNKLLIAGSLLTAIGILHGRFSSRVRISWRGMAATVLALSIATCMWFIDTAIRTSPVLHDITTDINDPPYFTHLTERSYDTNKPETFTGSRLSLTYSETLTGAYPHIMTITSKLKPEKMLIVAERLAKEMMWNINAVEQRNQQIEAVYTSPWFRLRSNIAIRVRADDAGSKLDIRATSALGLSDFGINAALIEDFVEALDKEIS